MRLDDLNALDRAAFTAALGDVFEHSPWIVEAAWTHRPFASLDALLEACAGVIAAAGEEAQVALLRAHPDLAGKAARAGALTEASTAEQAGAGLDRMDEEQYARFHALNDGYRETFGFPFIIAVKGLNREDILAAYERRVGNDRESELATATDQVLRIARFRIQALLDD